MCVFLSAKLKDQLSGYYKRVMIGVKRSQFYLRAKMSISRKMIKDEIYAIIDKVVERRLSNQEASEV